MGDHVSVFGLGKLGASMAAGMASRGFHVVGVDISTAAVTAVNEGRAPVEETGLGELIGANRERLRATTSTRDAVLESDISFVIVPTPSDQRGAFTLQYIRHALAGIGRALREKPGYHVVVVTSTVLPGSTRYGLLPVLERESGKQAGKGFGLCYSPEFIALGTVIRDFLAPDFYLIGELDQRSGDALEEVNRRVSQNGAPCHRMSLENAELAKIALNSFVTLKISFANTLAELCERIPGGNVDVVSDALGMDRRVGRRYLTGGLGFGGPCFPRDNLALSFIGESLGADCRLLRVNDEYNRSLSARIVERLRAQLPKGSTVAVLGLAYKPSSWVVEESPGIFMARALSNAGMRVLGYDPLAGGAARTVLQYEAVVVDTMEECLRGAGVVVVATPDPVFERLTAAQLLGDKERVTVIDFWRVLARLEGEAGIHYVAAGRGPRDLDSTAGLDAMWRESS
jgi:UDPglucose 6-dehydrogenase